MASMSQIGVVISEIIIKYILPKQGLWHQCHRLAS